MNPIQTMIQQKAKGLNSRSEAIPYLEDGFSPLNVWKKSGIYQILNLVNNHLYIGSAINLSSRARTHRNLLINNKHHSKYLQRSFNKYGLSNFKFEILEFCNNNILIEKEQYYLDKLNPQYNMLKIAGSSLGNKFSLETRQKIRESRIGTRASKETIEKLRISSKGRAPMKGKKHSIESRNKISEFMSKNNPFKGKQHTLETKLQLSQQKLGKGTRSISQFSLEGAFIRSWNSLKEATVYLQGNSSGLIVALKDFNKTFKGFKFKYND